MVSSATLSTCVIKLQTLNECSRPTSLISYRLPSLPKQSSLDSKSSFSHWVGARYDFDLREPCDSMSSLVVRSLVKSWSSN